MGLIYRVGLYIIFLIFTALNMYGSEIHGFSTIDSTTHVMPAPDSIRNGGPAGQYNDTVQVDSVRRVVPDSIHTDSLKKETVVHDSLKQQPVVKPKEKSRKDTVKYWKTGGCLTLNVSQIALSNWSSGGENSVAANALINLTANYAKGNAAWDNALDFGFGRLKRENTKAVKTDDRFELLTKYGRRIARKWYYSALLNFKTQVFPGYDYPEKDSVKISDFLSPGVAFISVGIDYKPSDRFSFLLSTVTGKTTIVKSKLLSAQEYFGIDSGKHFRHEFGGYLKLVMKGSLLKLVNYQLKVDAFSNYMEKPENVDWECELMLTARLNKYITANLKANLLYDDDIVTPPNKGPALQLREFVGIGFSYKF